LITPEELFLEISLLFLCALENWRFSLPPSPLFLCASFISNKQKALLHRAVHSQLLLHEVNRNGHRQILLREHKDELGQLQTDSEATSQKRDDETHLTFEREIEATVGPKLLKLRERLIGRILNFKSGG
jgi:hypothetical protein